MTKEVLTMSRKEIGRMEVIRRVVSKRLRQKEAACQLVLGRGTGADRRFSRHS